MLTVCSLGHTAAAEEKVSHPAYTGSPLLVLLAAEETRSVEIERQLVAELRLTLDGLQVEQIAIERADFLAVPLPEQLEVVQPLIKRFMARAAVWVVIGGRSGHLVQFVVSDGGNATVRSVGAGSPEELALAVRELLDSAYLYNPKPKTHVDLVTPAFFAVGTTLELTAGMVGHYGGSVLGGAGLQARLMPIPPLVLGCQLAGKIGPHESQHDGIALGWRTEISLFAAYLFSIGDFSAGPYIEGSAMRSSFNSVFEKGDFEQHTWWCFRGALGLEMSLKLTERLSFIVNWTAGGLSHQIQFTRSSDETAVLTTPRMDYTFTLGLVTAVL